MNSPIDQTTENRTIQRVAMIGGGPAGLMAAIHAAQMGMEATVFERMQRPGMKLLASGGGRANLSNTLPEADFIERYGRKGKFMMSALRELPRDEFLRLLAEWGAPCHAEDGFHYFPQSNRAEDVLEALLGRAKTDGVKILTRKTVTDLIVDDGRITGLIHDGETLLVDAVLLASGGAGYMGLGGGHAGYELAARVGHEIVPLAPGVLGLRARETWPGQCAGIVIKNSSARVLNKALARQVWNGDLLLTHRGVSGPCVLDCSASVCRILLEEPEVPLRVRVVEKEQDREKWRNHLAGWRRDHGSRRIRNLLGELAPPRMIEALCEAYRIAPDRLMARLAREEEESLLDILEGPILHVVDSEGFEKAMITSGGVSLKEVHPGTLQSKIVSGLFFAGEVLDLDGPCGGFNMQWAFSSGWLAGRFASIQ
jgi:predicted Rossmann fold flavoprotein